MTADKPMHLVPRLRFPEFRSAGDWHFQPLSDVAEPISERVGTSTCVPMSVTAGIGLISQIEKFGRTIAGNSYKNYIRLQTNDFAYNKSATKEFPQGYIARYSGTRDAAVPKSIFTCFRPDVAAIIPEYLDHLLRGNHHGRWLRKYITVGARAHGALSVSDDALMSMPVPLPPVVVSRPEQQKIADCLGSLDDLIAAEGRKLEALRQHKQGLLQQIFPQPGETVPRLRFPEFEDAPEWGEERLGNLVAIVSGKSPSHYALFAQGDCAFVKVEDLNNCSKYQVDAREYCNDVRGAVPSGSILFPKRGAAIENNKIRITASEILIDTNLMALTPCNTAETEFLYYYLVRVGLAQIADTSSIPQINNKHITPYRVLVPSESEQHRIADCLSVLDARLAAQLQKLNTLKTHKQSLLQQLFPHWRASEL